MARLAKAEPATEQHTALTNLKRIRTAAAIEAKAQNNLVACFIRSVTAKLAVPTPKRGTAPEGLGGTPMTQGDAGSARATTRPRKRTASGWATGTTTDTGTGLGVSSRMAGATAP